MASQEGLFNMHDNISLSLSDHNLPQNERLSNGNSFHQHNDLISVGSKHEILNVPHVDEDFLANQRVVDFEEESLDHNHHELIKDDDFPSLFFDKFTQPCREGYDQERKEQKDILSRLESFPHSGEYEHGKCKHSDESLMPGSSEHNPSNFMCYILESKSRAFKYECCFSHSSISEYRGGCSEFKLSQRTSEKKPNNAHQVMCHQTIVTSGEGS
jgi:hypothetical protein